MVRLTQINPPHCTRLVEIVPAPWTDPSVVDRAVALQRALGQAPVVLRREVPGFVLNRLQYALLMEAWRLVEVISRCLSRLRAFTSVCLHHVALRLMAGWGVHGR